ncbi:MAG: methylglyoxal synthase [Rhodospirillaceae bacterium]|nr:methylglyoxal synthase [Rhodospirillaceae bacterium]
MPPSSPATPKQPKPRPRRARKPAFAVGLVAHDRRKAAMVAWVRRNRSKLTGLDIFATGQTGARVARACPSLAIHRLKSGPLGGDQQLGALIAEGRLQMLIFFIDPLSPHPHDVDVKALLRLAILYDVPFACNAATADRIVPRTPSDLRTKRKGR